ncbi:malonyl-ACP O-methyltransferase BioC [Solilutibacter silvestris]|uniref:Malonyl-[acyl-carrier protein] O-methyltransferase n=1 Tax=Solilutibacter silvestris TaxID=1645665 RepID=A0A2K1Q0X2_9GAMM|nr:malonyl-ACP O-methyltransferase BioC [Lysobacter silvestris]PNS08696.1 BioC: biotin biosynthesis protein BioC [Lysobacter silvestris]
MNDLFDARQVRHAFGRAAQGYEEASALQREIESRLLESFDHYALRHGDAKPQVIVDLGCGPAHAAAWFRKQIPDARVIAIDAALPMLQAALPNTRGQWLRRKPVDRVCADLRALPLADASIDVLFCNLALQWIDDLPAAFAGFRRVLKPGGLLLCATFGPDTLYELRTAFEQADEVPHVSPFIDIAGFGDALVAAGFREPVLDRDLLVETLPDFTSVLRGLKAMGATNALHARRHSLSGRARFAAADAAYPRDGEGRFPLTWEAVYAQAWGPEPGTPIRDAGGELASVPLSRIPIRRR